MNKREVAKRVKVCTQDHGAPDNAATVYGHHAGRTCIRLAGTHVWIYSPGASAFDFQED
jgi:hypothetical protein